MYRFHKLKSTHSFVAWAKAHLAEKNQQHGKKRQLVLGSVLAISSIIFLNISSFCLNLSALLSKLKYLENSDKSKI